jgi:HEAT repeat protein
MSFLFGEPNIAKMRAKRNIKGLIKALNYGRYTGAQALGNHPKVAQIHDVRESARVALVILGASAVEPLIEALKQDKSSEVRSSAALALGDIGDPRAVEPLIEALKDEDAHIRRSAASALEGFKKDPRVVEPLIEALKDEDRMVRDSAASALGNIGDPRAVEPLIEVLKDAKYGDLCYDMIRALGRLRDPRAAPVVAVAVNNNLRFREEVGAEALTQIGPSALGPLIEAVQPQDPQGSPELDRYAFDWAVKVLKLRYRQALVELPISKLKDEEERVRILAAQILGQIGDPRAVEPLIEALEKVNGEDINQGECYWLIEALRKIGDPRAVEPIMAALDSGRYTSVIPAEKFRKLIATVEDPNIRAAALERLERMTTPEKVEPDTKIETKEILDCTGKFGPTHFTRIQNLVRSLNKGQICMVLVSDPGAIGPIKTLSSESGYSLIKTEKVGELTSFYIKKT